MGHSLVFADSFAHYNTAGIPLKWTTAGGAIETDPAHVRMGGPQSLRIQAGDSPTKTLFGSQYTILGFAWQTDTLAGEIIVDLTRFGVRQLALRQNADGSISLLTGVATVIATSAPGVLTIGPFWYIELASQIDPGTSVTQAIVTVTNAAGLATQVINTLGFVTSAVFWDKLLWGGPAAANHAWIDSFYFQDTWDTIGDPFAVAGAPKIYACVPIADGQFYVGPFNPTQTNALADAGPPFFSLCNSIPQNTATFILQNEIIVANVEQGFLIVGRAFPVDVSAIPLNAAIAGIQVVNLYSFAAGDTDPFQGSPGVMFGNTGQTGAQFNLNSNGGNTVFAGVPNVVLPYKYFTAGLSINTATGFPWLLGDFTGIARLQFGPWVGEPA